MFTKYSNGITNPVQRLQATTNICLFVSSVMQICKDKFKNANKI
jgi:hypothetical protein